METNSRFDAKDYFHRFDLRFGADGASYNLFEMMTGDWGRTISPFTHGDPGRDIAIGPDERIWLLKKAMGTSLEPDEGVDFPLYLFNGYSMLPNHSDGWDRVEGGEGVAVAADEKGQPWVVRASGEIYRLTKENGWEQVPGLATDIAIGANGDVWAIGTKDVFGGHEILHWTGEGWEEVDTPIGGMRIAVSPEGEPWYCDDKDQIMRGLGNRWYRVLGSAVDLAFGADGNLWCLGGHDSAQGGSMVFHWNGRDWDRIQGCGVRIAVQPNGMPWMINRRGSVYPRILDY